MTGARGTHGTTGAPPVGAARPARWALLLLSSRLSRSAPGSNRVCPRNVPRARGLYRRWGLAPRPEGKAAASVRSPARRGQKRPPARPDGGPRCPTRRAAVRNATLPGRSRARRRGRAPRGRACAPRRGPAWIGPALAPRGRPLPPEGTCRRARRGVRAPHPSRSSMHQAIARRESGGRRRTELARTALAVVRLADRASRARQQGGAPRAPRRDDGRPRARRRP